MINHVAGRKMRLSKLLFIALVAVCLVFMKVNADPADEVEVENEGEAIAPGAQAVEAGAEMGESQAAQDVVRSQMATTRGPTRSQTPSKSQKGSKVKIAIVIGLIVLMLSIVATSVGIFVIKPKMRAAAEKKLSERLKEGLSEGTKFESKKLGKDKKERIYLTHGEALSEEAEKKAAATFKKVEEMSGAKKTKEGVFIPLGKADAQKELCKALGSPIPDGADNADKHTAAALSAIAGGNRVIRLEGKGLFLTTSDKLKADGGDKKDGKDKKAAEKKE